MTIDFYEMIKGIKTLKNIVIALLFIIRFLVNIEYSFAQSTQIISVTPSFNQIAANTQPTISATFNTPMDSVTFNRISFAVFGERSGYKEGVITYNKFTNTVTFVPNIYFIAGEQVIVTLARSICTSIGDSLNGFSWSFRVPSKNVGINFSDPVAYEGGGYGMQCVDMNNDGSPDIVTSSGVILLNNGNGQFNSSWTLPDADGFGEIAVDDFNRDGIMDVLYTGSDCNKVGLSDGTGSFAISTTPFRLYGYITADFNNDGYPDIAGFNVILGANPPYSDTTSYWAIALNNGAGKFVDTTWMGIVDGWFKKMTTVDIDNDGDLDVVIISQHAAGGDVYPHGFEGIIVFKNDGKGIFNQLELYPAGNYFDIYFPEFVYSSDFNNDSFTDIAVMADFAGTILLNSGEGAFTNDSANTRTFWGAEQISPFTCADINGDKWIDIVKSGYKFPPEMPITYYAIVTNCNSNFFNCSGSNFFGYKLPDVLIYAAAAVDLDADSDVDLVHAGEGIFITLNRDTINSVYDNYEQPEDFSVYQNYPNPFNSQTKIIFIANKIEFIHITIYNVLGEEVRLLENKMFLPGKNSVIWDGKDNGGSSLPSGIYFIHAKASTSAQTIKAILLK